MITGPLYVYLSHKYGYEHIPAITMVYLFFDAVIFAIVFAGLGSAF